MNVPDRPYIEQRERMVSEQLIARGISDIRVLEAMREVPRERFVPDEHRRNAYADRALPLAPGVTISQPYVIALMLQALELKPENKVLEIGTGSGYQAALLARLVKSVITLEIDGRTKAAADERLEKQRCSNVISVLGDGFEGWPEEAPYDAIVVAAAPPEVPRSLIQQLAHNGRLVLPLGEDDDQELILFEKNNGELRSRELGHVRFVSMHH